jgi:uncharacterized protein involved in exopolysaccharide biosynthesis
MQMKPYSRGETLPVPLTDARGPIAERTGPGGYAGGNGYSGYSANGHHPSTNGQVSQPALQPSYLQVLIEHCKKRWKLLVLWMALTSAVAYWMVQTYGKPMWRAEGNLYYSPNYSFSHKRLYTPPNIQTVIQRTKSREILEKVRAEKNISAPVDQLQARLNVNVVRQSDLITIQFDWPDRDEAATIAARIQELAIEHYEHKRRKDTEGPLKDLDATVIDTQKSLYAARDKLSEALEKKRIFDLQTEKDNIIREIASIESQIDKSRSEKTKFESKIRQVKAQIKAAEMEDGSKNGALTEAQLNFLATMRQIKERQVSRQREVDQAKAQLKAKEEEHKKSIPLAQKGYITRQEMLKLESEIASLKVITDGSGEIQEMENTLKRMEKQLLESKQGATTQARFKLEELEVDLNAVPEEIERLNTFLDERRKRQSFLQSVEKEVMPLQQEVRTHEQNLASLTLQKSEHAKIDHLEELTVQDVAAVGSSPISSNNIKILVAVFGVAMLLFVGFVAVRDMPRFAHTGANTAERNNLPVLAQYGPRALALPAARTPTPDLTSEQLRLLAERIDQSIGDNGAIVLFAPAMHGLRIEALVADLGCFCAQRGGKVLVFDARPLPEHPNVPSWVGTSSNGVDEQLVGYLDGQSENLDSCFTPTLIHAIDYTRGDLGKHLAGVMAMYRFRRLTHELRDRYSLVLMITPERYRGGDDFFSNVAEGIVVVLSEDANPAEVESYVQQLREGDTPVFGAVTVPNTR